jgi:hypothetical protein
VVLGVASLAAAGCGAAGHHAGAPQGQQPLPPEGLATPSVFSAVIPIGGAGNPAPQAQPTCYDYGAGLVCEQPGTLTLRQGQTITVSLAAPDGESFQPAAITRGTAARVMGQRLVGYDGETFRLTGIRPGTAQLTVGAQGQRGAAWIFTIVVR